MEGGGGLKSFFRTYQANGSNAKPMAPTCAKSAEGRDRAKHFVRRGLEGEHPLYISLQRT